MNDAHGDLRSEGDPTDASGPRSPRPPSGGSTTPPPATNAPAPETTTDRQASPEATAAPPGRTAHNTTPPSGDATPGGAGTTDLTPGTSPGESTPKGPTATTPSGDATTPADSTAIPGSASRTGAFPGAGTSPRDDSATAAPGTAPATGGTTGTAATPGGTMAASTDNSAMPGAGAAPGTTDAAPSPRSNTAGSADDTAVPGAGAAASSGETAVAAASTPPAGSGSVATTTRPGGNDEFGGGPGAVPGPRTADADDGHRTLMSPGSSGETVAVTTATRTLPGGAERPGSQAPQTSARNSGRGAQAGAQVNVRQERREQTRTALLSAAERLWAERGIHGASLDDIAAAAGLTKGAVYSNFAGKTDLLLALLERFTSDRLSTEVCDELRSADQSRDDGGRTGRNATRDGSDDRARRLALLLVEFWLYGMRDYAAGWRIADWYAERRAHMASELRDVDGIAPSERATLAMALDFGLAFQHLLDPDRVPADLYSTGIDLMLGRAAS